MAEVGGPGRMKDGGTRRVLLGTKVETRRSLVQLRVTARSPVATLVCVIRAAGRRLNRLRVAPPPQPPLLFTSFGRRKGDSFDCASRRAPAPPSRITPPTTKQNQTPFTGV